ncbi:helix-turn-helix transcriptional regulator [Streptomyces sp. MS1.HAVA.3]|uniref:Helix-turn-helix transcriptional regulator n=1 Tax=Streptomyces caledonius TaxID=3134107 RepID=A0ABU8UDU1_9ACTN
MAHTEPLTPTGTVAKRVREVRKRRGLTAEQLALKLREQGIPWDRYTVNKLENGKRQNISLTEWLALAEVLNVAPVHLLTPTDTVEGDQYQVTPERAVPVAHAREWVRGHDYLDGADPRSFHAETPREEWNRNWLPLDQDAFQELLKAFPLVTRGDQGGQH